MYYQYTVFPKYFCCQFFHNINNLEGVQVSPLNPPAYGPEYTIKCPSPADHFKFCAVPTHCMYSYPPPPTPHSFAMSAPPHPHHPPPTLLLSMCVHALLACGLGLRLEPLSPKKGVMH